MIKKSDLLMIISEQEERLDNLAEAIRLLNLKQDLLTDIVEELVDMLPDKVSIAIKVPKEAKPEKIKVNRKTTNKKPTDKKK